MELPKTEEGLGFNVMGGKEQNSPIYISRIIPGGVAERHGGLKRGDQLLSVNGVVRLTFTIAQRLDIWIGGGKCRYCRLFCPYLLFKPASKEIYPPLKYF